MYQILFALVACKRLKRRQLFRIRLFYPIPNQVDQVTEAGAVSCNSGIDPPKGIRTWWKLHKT